MNKGIVHYKDEARKIFSRTKYCQSGRPEDNELLETQIHKLANNMMVMDNKGLSEINRKLIESGRKVWDFIAEHNFAVQLLKDNQNAYVEYEPDYLDKPVDFVIKKQGISYWLQMKRLSMGERENRQQKIFQAIRESLKDIEVPKFVWVMLAEDFGEEDIKPLVAVIQRKAKKENNKRYRFQYYGRPRKAEFYFTVPRKKGRLQSLFLRAYGDAGVVNVTGLDTSQVRYSLQKASEAFDWDSNSQNINVIVMEADNFMDIDIAEACFGTEYFFLDNGNMKWGRKNDGYFAQKLYSQKVAGVIAVRRLEHEPISSEYSNTLFINEKHADKLTNVLDLIHLGTVIHYDDYVGT